MFFSHELSRCPYVLPPAILKISNPTRKAATVCKSSCSNIKIVSEREKNVFVNEVGAVDEGD
jgi:hypothetical protein